MVARRAADVAEVLRELLERREQKRIPARVARVVGRNSDGSARLQRLDGECVARGDSPGYVGEMVIEFPSLLGRDGTRGNATVRSSRSLTNLSQSAIFRVSSISPSVLPRGSVGLVVTVTGRGLSATMQFAFGIPGALDVNPDVTVTAVTFVDTETIELTVDVAADADLYTDLAPLFYDDPMRP